MSTTKLLKRHVHPAVLKALSAEAALTSPTARRQAQVPAVLSELAGYPRSIRVQPFAHGKPTKQVTLVRKGARVGAQGGVYQLWHIKGQVGTRDFEMHAGQVRELFLGRPAIVSGNHSVISAKHYVAL